VTIRLAASPGGSPATRSQRSLSRRESPGRRPSLRSWHRPSTMLSRMTLLDHPAHDYFRQWGDPHDGEHRGDHGPPAPRRRRPRPRRSVGPGPRRTETRRASASWPPRVPNRLCEPDASCLPQSDRARSPGNRRGVPSGYVSPSAGRSDVRTFGRVRTCGQAEQRRKSPRPDDVRVDANRLSVLRRGTVALAHRLRATGHLTALP
jgi:hypothetical protein